LWCCQWSDADSWLIGFIILYILLITDMSFTLSSPRHTIDCHDPEDCHPVRTNEHLKITSESQSGKLALQVKLRLMLHLQPLSMLIRGNKLSNSPSVHYTTFHLARPITPPQCSKLSQLLNKHFC
jgi:hypothetical protein